MSHEHVVYARRLQIVPRMLASQDYLGGRPAFAARREPAWTGR